MKQTTSSCLCCPKCLGGLEKLYASYRCNRCSEVYAVQSGIPQLVNARLTADVSLSQTRWQELHKKEKLSRDTTQDLTISSYVRFLETYDKQITQGKFLDLGCGVARLSCVLARKGIDVTGVDISREALMKSKMLFNDKNAEGAFVRGDLLALPFRDESFTFIYSCMSLEYVKDTGKALGEAYRVLAKGGIMAAILPVVSFTTLTYHQTRGDIPGIPGLRRLMEYVHIHLLKGKLMHYGYEQSFTVAGLRRLFQNAGFRTVKIRYFDTHYPLLFLPSPIRTLAQQLLKHRLFWPLVYIEGKK